MLQKKSTPAVSTAPADTDVSTTAEEQGEVLGASCTPYLTRYLKRGADNNAEDVKKLQTFLNKELGLSIPVTGYFGPLTEDAVRAFQLKYSKEILTPWLPFGLLNESMSTGYVYKTTLRWINKLSCPDADIPMPSLP